MIPKKARAGGRTTGLLYYLFGPGKRDEHTNPHLVAAWDDRIIATRDPGVVEGASLPALARLLDAPVEAMEGGRPVKHVYHVPVRNDLTDRELSDAEWNAVAREILDAAGIAPKDDPARSCRWVAVRHADDHIHLVATLATAEGRQPNLRQDVVRMQDRARVLERRYGLRQLASGDKTAKTWPTQAELSKAERKGRAEAPRATLQEKVREAAAGARGEPDFFSRLGRAGIRVRQRTAPDGNVTGYSVALPGDRTGGGRAVWYSGSRLAPDLSLPRVRERWAVGGGADTSSAAGVRAETWQQAAARVEQAAAALARAGDAEGAGIVAALGDVLTTYSADAPRWVRGELRTAAQAFERAARAPHGVRADSQARRYLSDAARQLAAGAMLADDGNETAAAIAMLTALVLAVLAAQRWHESRQYRMQAEGARVAAQELRAAGQMATGAASGGRRAPRGDRRTAARTEDVERRYEPVIRGVLPGRAEEVLRDEAWPALASTLADAQSAGYDPRQVLAEVTAQRELGTAESVAQVLRWRLQGRMRRDVAAPPGTGAEPAAKRSTPRPSRRPLGEQTAAQRAAQKSGENRPRGPQR